MQSRLLIGLVAILLVFTGASAQNAVISAPATRLVIIGASYAGSWKVTELPGYGAVTNKGVGGEQTQQMLARFDRDVTALRPTAVLIWGHINNIHRAGAEFAVAKEQVKSDYRAMVERAQRAGIQVILGTEVTLSEAVGWRNRLAALIGRLRGKQGYNATINQHVRDVNAWMRAYAQEQRIRLLDFEKALDDGDGFRKPEYTQEDGSHIAPAGYAELTRYARAQLGGR
jgi:lysophospholipase L1-like esterase